MEQIILPQVSEKTIAKNSAEFTIAPLFPGYGHTVGNGLRRVLLSSLPGASVTSVRLVGAEHEFTTVPGVKEDVVELILNLKTLRVEMHETEEPVTVFLHCKGPAEVKAKDFEKNSKVSISNPELHIATVAAKSSLDLEVTVEYGRGYVPIEKRESKSSMLGVIAVDSLYSPVQAVSIEVENTRVGKMTNYDQLLLSITTDGSITPADSLKQASAILVDQFALLAEFDQRPVTAPVTPVGEIAEASDDELIAAGLPVRIARVLSDRGIGTIAQLRQATDDDLKSTSGLGPKALQEIARIRK